MTATDMTTDMPAGENAEKVTERELLPIAGGRQTWKWLRAAPEHGNWKRLPTPLRRAAPLWLLHTGLHRPRAPTE